jgi:hypothetical protein
LSLFEAAVSLDGVEMGGDGMVSGVGCRLGERLLLNLLLLLLLLFSSSSSSTNDASSSAAAASNSAIRFLLFSRSRRNISQKSSRSTFGGSTSTRNEPSEKQSELYRSIDSLGTRSDGSQQQTAISKERPEIRLTTTRVAFSLRISDQSQ